MKKYLVAVAVLLASAFAMNAQNDTFKDELTDKFMEKDQKLSSMSLKKSECTIYSPGMFGIGMISTNAPTPFDFNTKKSIEVFYYDMYDTHIAGNFYFTYGGGFGWKNFTLDGTTALRKDSNGDIFAYEYLADDSFKLSRLRIFSYSIPLFITYDFHHDCGLSFGPVINANISSRVNTKYNDGTPKDKYRKVHEQPVTLDLMADLTIWDIHFWVKYSPMNQMKKDHGWPEFQTISFGIGL